MNKINLGAPHPELNRRPAQSDHHVAAGHSRSVPSKRSLTMINFIGGLAAFGLAASPLHADGLSAMAGESIHVGGFHGVFYYTDENDGYRVVATIAEGEAGVPVRFSATLAEGQSATISVPGKLGEPSQSLEISRSDDKLVVTDVGPMSNKKRIEALAD
ncbi:hypothetical protein IE4872_CH03325 [Rhizobium gallicum]|uniref:Uncharacterized protein n=1 Tax=Rhizobium gallicum TaxID=56730 RepID=A0A1L5NLZ0_9HYPH|nr:hypothetical protein [Rhizobium gallicum]APO68925.1 hypothetical protein IE4872_CH03325 [Rhizobium gallicum]